MSNPKLKLEHYPQLPVESADDLRQWLEANHAQAGSVWTVRWKKVSGRSALAYTDLVDELLCFGWIDSLPRKLDAVRTMLLISPRKPRSGWSAVNKAKIERLIADGRMHPAGLAAIERAKADGSWTLLDSSSNLEVPPDLEAALVLLPPAETHFLAFPPSARRGILEWIAQAKTPTTRQKRIDETARMAQQNERANAYIRKA